MSYDTPAFKGRSGAFRAAMAESAARRQCPGCGRKSAVSRVESYGYVYRVCRWCDWHSEPREFGELPASPDTAKDEG